MPSSIVKARAASPARENIFNLIVVTPVVVRGFF
jgi:hypothetical protein